MLNITFCFATSSFLLKEHTCRIISASPPQMLVNISSSTPLFPLQKSDASVQLMEEIYIWPDRGIPGLFQECKYSLSSKWLHGFVMNLAFHSNDLIFPYLKWGWRAFGYLTGWAEVQAPNACQAPWEYNSYFAYYFLLKKSKVRRCCMAIHTR